MVVYEKVNVIGAGGHSRSLLGLLSNVGYKCIGLYDDHFVPGEEVLGVPVRDRVGKIPLNLCLVLAVGDNMIRSILSDKYASIILRENLVHNTADIEPGVKMGVSNQVFANAYVNVCSQLGDNNIINTGAIIEHEAKIGSHNHVSVGATLLGRSLIGDYCMIGAGAIVKDCVSVCDNVIIGSNSFVNKDITASGTYAGSPLRRIQ